MVEQQIEQQNVLIDELCREINRTRHAAAWADSTFFGWASSIAALQAEMLSALPISAPVRVDDLESLPPITTDVFRYADVRAFPKDRPTSVAFQTSGTTARFRGRHALYRTDIYERSALRAFDLLVDAEGALERLVSLVPPWEALVDSSLSFMLSVFARERFAGRASFVVGSAGVDAGALGRALRDAAADEDAPALVFTTTLAAQALVALESPIRLPAGSVVLTTGGAKGRLTRADHEATESALADRFPGARIGAEFGMTELLSQAYRFGSEPFRLPPWCRVLAVDPATGERVPPGEPGLLRFVDLANVQSAVAVQTADLGSCDSDNAFFYIGRAPGAPLRGCSLTFEELSGGVHVSVV